MIISSVTLGLVVVLVVSLIIWFCAVRRKKTRGTKASLAQSTENQGELLRRAGDEEEAGQSVIGVGMEIRVGEERGMEEARISFNPMNMVVPRNVVTSMAESQAGSQVTTITNPPPPYGNSNQGGSGRSDWRSSSNPGANQGAFEGRGSGDLLRPTSALHPHPAESVVQPGPLSRTAPMTVGADPVRAPSPTIAKGNQFPYNFESTPKYLPSPLTVQYTFTPTSGDELGVKKGDQLRVVGVFDDGWCLCKTEAGRRGVVPLACFDMPSGNGLAGENGAGVGTTGEGIGAPTNDDGGGSRGNESGNEEGILRRSVRVESRNVSIVQDTAYSSLQNSVPFPTTSPVDP